MAETLKTTATVIGIDIGKNSFHIVGLDRRGAIVLRQKWSRGQVAARTIHWVMSDRNTVSARCPLFSQKRPNRCNASFDAIPRRGTAHCCEHRQAAGAAAP